MKLRIGSTVTVLGLVLAQLSWAASPTRPAASIWVCVTNERSGDLTVVDGSSRKIVATIPLGKRPRGIHASPDGRYVYVALSGTPVADPAEQPSTTQIASFPDGRAANRWPDGIAVVDLGERRVVRVIPAGANPEEFAVDPQGTRLFVSNGDAATVSTIRIADGRTEHTTRVDGGPEAVTLSPDARSVYVACETGGSVVVVDGKTGERVDAIALGGRPSSIAFQADGSCAFVPSETDGELHIIDTASRKIRKTLTLPAGARPRKAVLRPDGKALYVTTGEGGTVCVVDPVKETLVQSIRVGDEPRGAAASPDGRWLYVANGDDLSVVDTQSNREVARVPAGQGPWGVAVVRAPKARRAAAR